MSLNKNILDLYTQYLQKTITNITINNLEPVLAIKEQTELINKEILNKRKILTSNSFEMQSLTHVNNKLEKLHYNLISQKQRYTSSLFIEIVEKENELLDQLHNLLGEKLDNVIKFFVDHLGETNELTVLIIEMSLDKDIINHINRYGSRYFHKYLKETTTNVQDSEIRKELNIN